jgi:thymidylate synthase
MNIYPTQKIKQDNYHTIYMVCMKKIMSDYDFSNDDKRSTSEENTREVIDLSFVLTDPKNNRVFSQVRNVDYDFGDTYFDWMISGSNDISELGTKYKEIASRYVDPFEKNHRTYGQRISEQLESVTEELCENVNSRRGIINILEPSDKTPLLRNLRNAKSVTEFPCCESLLFFIRDSQLHLKCNMRSNNMTTTVCYDVYMFTKLQEYILGLLRQLNYPNLELGNYYHNVSSAHIFGDQVAFCEEILKDNLKK